MKRRPSLRQLSVMAFLLGPSALADEAAPEEITAMQRIEPGFVPPDTRAIELFSLQQKAAQNEESIKQKNDDTTLLRRNFSQKFRSNLNNFTEHKIKPLDTRYDQSVASLIANYEQALKNYPKNSPRRAETMYFLGLYYFEVDEKVYFAKLAEYSKAKDEGREDVDYPEENFTRTINIYEKLIKEYPDFYHMSDVYYLLALALWYEGAFYQSVDYFKTLIKKFPESRFVDEVWFRLGEYYYDMDEFNDARDAYAHIVAKAESPLYDKALYKLAWTYYQQDKFDLAIKYFIQVLELTHKESGEGSAAVMRSEVTKYIVKSFAEQLYIHGERRQKIYKNKTLKDEEKEYAERMGVKLFKNIHNYFNTHERPLYLRDIYLEAASQLLDESKSEGAVLALQAVIDLDPKSSDNPRIESQIIDIWQDAHKLLQAERASIDLIKNYNKQSAWSQAKAGDIHAQLLARDAVRDALLWLAVHNHRLGKFYKEEKQEKRSDEHFAQAAAYYLEYIHEYPERDDTPKALFYYAESSYEINNFAKALEAYELLKNYPLPVADNFRRDAVYNIVFTFKHVLEQEAREGRFKYIDFETLTAKQRGLEREEIPALGKKYLQAIADFVKIAPNDEQVPVLLFHSAAIYYVYGHWDNAMARFFYIIDNYPSSGAGVVAAKLVVDDAVAQNDWARVIKLSKRFAESKLGKPEEFKRLESNAKFKLAHAVFEQANALYEQHQLAQAKAKYQEAAQLFAVLLQEDPKSPYADVMLWNSARAKVLSGNPMEALPLYKKLYISYPRSEYAKLARFQEALALEKMLKFTEAAQAYDGIIKHEPNTEAAQDALLNKALLYEAAGNNPQAIAAFIAFAKKYPKHAEAPEALLSAAALYKKDRDLNREVEVLEAFTKQYRKDPNEIAATLRAHVSIGDSYGALARSAKTPEQKRRYAQAQVANYKAAVNLFSQKLASPLASFYAAKAQLFLDKPEFDAFLKTKINGRTGKAQAEQLTSMTKQLASLAAKNENIIKTFAQPVWNAESLYRIGSLYEHLAKSILRAPCPTDVRAIDEFACDEYIVLLEDKAAVLEEKALDAFTQAYDIAIASYDAPAELLESIQAALNRVRPGKYQRVGKAIENPQPGAFEGQGRMLSTGRMASSLHEQEVDPDIKKPEPVAPQREPAHE